MNNSKCVKLIKGSCNTPMQDTAATVESAALTQFMVQEVLAAGAENAITAQELCDRLGFDSVRELQKEIARERAAGAVILSSSDAPGGYYTPSSSQEVKRFIKTLENRAKNTFLALRSARNYIRQQGEADGRSEMD